MKKVLVTGFDPFGGEPVNPALEAVKKLGSQKMEAAEIFVQAVPTVFHKSIQVLQQAIDGVKPDLVICVGQAGGRSDISIERVAINVDDARIPDNEGNQPIDEPIVMGGPVAYWSTLPVKATVEKIRQAGIPASVSQTAGTYVCNHLFYGLCHILAKNPAPVRGGFVHIPYLPEQAVRHPGQPSMSLENVVRALEIVIQTSILFEQDIRVAGGQIN